MTSLQQEWLQKSLLLGDSQLVSLYFGGGTPALLGPERISEILSWISPESSTEVTLEANPENSTLDCMKGFKQAGINRISIGIQTFDDSLLKLLGRQHTSKRAEQAVLWAKEAGIDNISIDLMYDLPSQTLESWQTTLDRAFTLPITHVSLYNLTIEPHTIFYKKRAHLQPHLPSEETSLKMLNSAIEKAELAGFLRYEISAFAKFGQQSCHNRGYWTERPFLGLGPSAYSFWEGSRFRNIANLNRYCKRLQAKVSPIDFSETLPSSALLKEQLAVRLRLLEGLPIEHHPLLPAETQATLHRLAEMGLIIFDKTAIRLSPQGLLFHDWIASEIVEDMPAESL